ncbi:DUF6457 domain-containing protein [Leifsonia sp. NPDC058292]|uniref:DUF6457 domain-containing protein n=1 Tax=Leifsonia sp. NPDC058292 TaxID=3346428 RepID=UPI0036DB1031
MNDLDEWLTALSDHLGCEVPADVVGPVLDLARDAAHNVTRPAAPLSAFVAGYAAGLAASPTAVGEAAPGVLDIVERARAFAEAWPNRS